MNVKYMPYKKPSNLKVFLNGCLCGAMMFGIPTLAYFLKFGFK